MADNIDQTYRYLDTREDREALLKDMHKVREAALKISQIVPENEWYTLRYHGWSLAAMLGHLQLMDSLNLWQIKLALLGIPVAPGITTVNSFNNFMARIYQNRLLDATRRGIARQERTLADFILNLPVDKFTIQVFHAPSNKYLTVEQAIQVSFLHHWEQHLRTMQEAEGIHDEPSSDAGL